MSSEAPEEILLPATNGETAEEPEVAECLGEDPMRTLNDVEENEKDIFAEVSEAAETPDKAPDETPSNDKAEEPTITVVPKKRKTSTTSAPETDEVTENTTEAGPSTSRAAAAVKENQVDENQCRVCTAKEELVSLFKVTEEKKTIAQLLMMLCPSVSIALKDFMPQFVCYPCFGKINLAIQLKSQCEKTENELRKKLSRHKNKVRRPAGYVVVDAPLESDPESDEEPNDDVEFKVSEASAEEDDDDDDDDSDDSDFSEKKRPTRGRGVRRKSAATPSIKPKKAKTIKREIFVDTNSAGKMKKKVKKTSDADEKPEFRCEHCDQVFSRKVSLVLHKRTHITEKSSFWCELCGKQFKIQGAYRSHLEKHKNETNGFACERCDEIYVSNADLKRHLAEDHNEQGLVYTCEKCKRTFVSKTRLQKHASRCPGIPKKKSEFDGFPVGQDLFKTVAPLTTTYWSDSFSE